MKISWKIVYGPIRHPCVRLIAMSDFICVIALLNVVHREPDTFTLNTLPWKGLQITEINGRHLGTAQQWHARFKSAWCSPCFRLMKHAKAKKDNISFLVLRTLYARRYFCQTPKINTPWVRSVGDTCTHRILDKVNTHLRPHKFSQFLCARKISH